MITSGREGMEMIRKITIIYIFLWLLWFGRGWIFLLCLFYFVFGGIFYEQKEGKKKKKKKKIPLNSPT